jgi:hypothetical protein
MSLFSTQSTTLYDVLERGFCHTAIDAGRKKLLLLAIRSLSLIRTAEAVRHGFDEDFFLLKLKKVEEKNYLDFCTMRKKTFMVNARKSENERHQSVNQSPQKWLYERERDFQRIYDFKYLLEIFSHALAAILP